MSDQESTVLYRKYRPDTFAAVRGQDHIVSVLEGAIKKNTIPHAVLFSGGRGTGKTTLARLFAGALGVQVEDLYEIDAASNRGIDDVRALREAVHTLPYQSPYKVYIVDEVHMLTKEAFNALLKTLEEPPAHVIFMLATTEEDKLLDTILSRCQIFRLRNPNRALLAEHVTEVAKKEGFTLAPEAADLIALAADGSFRDALGVTQKIILASGDAIGAVDEVAAIIGAPKSALVADLMQALHEKDIEKGMQALAAAQAAHVQATFFVRVVLERVRAVMLCRNSPEAAADTLAHFGEAEQAYIRELAAVAGSAINSHLLLRLLEAAQQVNRSSLPYLPLELVLLEFGESAPS